MADETRQQRWRRENPERAHENDRRWREANRERLRGYQAAWRRAKRAADPEAVRDADRARYAASRERIRARMQARFDENRDANLLALRADGLQRRYGLSLEEYDRLLAAQGGVCAICGGPPIGRPNLDVDHDHLSGQVRGLLCSSCNVLLGHAKDDLDRLAAAIAYLQSWTRELDKTA